MNARARIHAMFNLDETAEQELDARLDDIEATTYRMAADLAEQTFIHGITPAASERDEIWDDAVRAVATTLRQTADGEQSSHAADAAANFFQRGRNYTRNLPYRAPELRPDFQCVGVGQHPTKDEPRAFGFYRSGSMSPWGSVALMVDEWAEGWVDITEGGDGR